MVESGGRDVEGNVVFPCQDGQPVGTDFVGHVAVGGNSVGAYDDAVDVLLPQDRRRHAVADHRNVNAALPEFPRREPRSLQKRAGFIGKDGDLFPGFDGCIYYGQRRTVICGSQGARVAMGEYGGIVIEQFGAVLSDLPADSPVFLEDFVRFLQQPVSNLRRMLKGDFVEPSAHPLECPEEVHGRGPGAGKSCDCLPYPGNDIGSRGQGFPGADNDAVRRGHADGRGAPDPKALNGFGNGFHVSAVDPNITFRKKCLIDQPKGVVFPGDGWNRHRSGPSGV